MGASHATTHLPQPHAGTCHAGTGDPGCHHPPHIINVQSDALKSHFSVTAGSSPMPAGLVQVKEEPLSFYHFSALGTQNLDINGIIGAVTRQYP
ncbi:hypothetical protein ACK330_01060 [Aeromonas taiwanensis]|uniref:hypothetical protein n=1 Tax=Aeromonas taiwanensis TaxID=633417 RepID=UPI0039893615